MSCIDDLFEGNACGLFYVSYFGTLFASTSLTIFFAEIARRCTTIILED